MIAFGPMSAKLLSTVEVADALSVPRATLQYWIKEGKLSAPRTRLRNGVAVRLWAAADVEKARKLRGTLKRGPDPKKGKRSKV